MFDTRFDKSIHVFSYTALQFNCECSIKLCLVFNRFSVKKREYVDIVGTACDAQRRLCAVNQFVKLRLLAVNCSRVCG